MIGVTHEALKTKPQMRRKVHQVKEGREVLEKLQEFSEENGKDDTEWRDFAARFNRLDAAVQLQQGAETLETAQLGTPDDELLWRPRFGQPIKGADGSETQSCKSDVWNPDKTLNIPTRGSGAYPIMKNSM